MILSVSRRTDIPAFYTEWFMNRIHKKYVLTRNPMNYHQVSRIPITRDVVDFIVFWSKNPAPLLPYLDEIGRDYPFYFQFTLNPYDQDLEPNLPLQKERIDTFRCISENYGKERIIWRYDPIILSQKYDLSWHVQQFERLADKISPYTDTCVFSFVDIYDKIKNKLAEAKHMPITSAQIDSLASCFSMVASDHQVRLMTCAEDVALDQFGIEHSCCIDSDLIERITGCKLTVKKDSTQRSQCHCAESIDIGQYNTCRHGCKYCYANYSVKSVQNNYIKHDPKSPLLIGNLEREDKVIDRKVKSLRQDQLSLF